MGRLVRLSKDVVVACGWRLLLMMLLLAVDKENEGGAMLLQPSPFARGARQSLLNDNLLGGVASPRNSFGFADFRNGGTAGGLGLGVAAYPAGRRHSPFPFQGQFNPGSGSFPQQGSSSGFGRNPFGESRIGTPPDQSRTSAFKNLFGEDIGQSGGIYGSFGRPQDSQQQGHGFSSSNFPFASPSSSSSTSSSSLFASPSSSSPFASPSGSPSPSSPSKDNVRGSAARAISGLARNRSQKNLLLNEVGKSGRSDPSVYRRHPFSSLRLSPLTQVSGVAVASPTGQSPFYNQGDFGERPGSSVENRALNYRHRDPFERPISRSVFPLPSVNEPIKLDLAKDEQKRVHFAKKNNKLPPARKLTDNDDGRNVERPSLITNGPSLIASPGNGNWQKVPAVPSLPKVQLPEKPLETNPIIGNKSVSNTRTPKDNVVSGPISGLKETVEKDIPELHTKISNEFNQEEERKDQKSETRPTDVIESVPGKYLKAESESGRNEKEADIGTDVIFLDSQGTGIISGTRETGESTSREKPQASSEENNADSAIKSPDLNSFQRGQTGNGKSDPTPKGNYDITVLTDEEITKQAGDVATTSLNSPQLSGKDDVTPGDLPATKRVVELTIKDGTEEVVSKKRRLPTDHVGFILTDDLYDDTDDNKDDGLNNNYEDFDDFDDDVGSYDISKDADSKDSENTAFGDINTGASSTIPSPLTVGSPLTTYPDQDSRVGKTASEYDSSSPNLEERPAVGSGYMVYGLDEDPDFKEGHREKDEFVYPDFSEPSNQNNNDVSASNQQGQDLGKDDESPNDSMIEKAMKNAHIEEEHVNLDNLKDYQKDFVDDDNDGVDEGGTNGDGVTDFNDYNFDTFGEKDYIFGNYDNDDDEYSINTDPDALNFDLLNAGEGNINIKRSSKAFKPESKTVRNLNDGSQDGLTSSNKALGSRDTAYTVPRNNRDPTNSEISGSESSSTGDDAEISDVNHRDDKTILEAEDDVPSDSDQELTDGSKSALVKKEPVYKDDYYDDDSRFADYEYVYTPPSTSGFPTTSRFGGSSPAFIRSPFKSMFGKSVDQAERGSFGSLFQSLPPPGGVGSGRAGNRKGLFDERLGQIIERRPSLDLFGRRRK
ncbi:uncharacterized protein LOC101849538 [Aplysia californica]|uniref:Uncharacterized protein LOC101849538 n=1 Tax=Aplysia californica TaxID=6500 RepID=A0ABM1A0L7_APLCA|nr:uncharacterized protein LOC101849538 [Aplysia californica]XP_012938409.1 uncharacterized protein LOC101849538 [Aplysia californica]